MYKQYQKCTKMFNIMPECTACKLYSHQSATKFSPLNVANPVSFDHFKCHFYCHIFAWILLEFLHKILSLPLHYLLLTIYTQHKIILYAYIILLPLVLWQLLWSPSAFAYNFMMIILMIEKFQSTHHIHISDITMMNIMYFLWSLFYTVSSFNTDL